MSDAGAPTRPYLCPFCSSPLREGVAGVRATFFSLDGPGEHLWFRTPGEKKPSRVLTSGDEVTAHRCDSCRAVVIPPPPTVSDRLDAAAQRISTYLKERRQEPRARPEAKDK